MVNQIKQYIKNNNYQLVIDALISLSAHFFFIVNVLHNYDSVAVLPAGYGTGITSGRWLLTILGDYVGRIWGNYNIPFFNGIVTLILLLISACIVLDLFRIKTAWVGAIWISIFLCFPTVTSTLFYIYTAPYYAAAVLMAVTSVWITVRYRYGFLISPILQACSLGIYQAYYPMIVTLFVLLLISQILEKMSTIKEITVRGFAYLGLLISGMVAYFIALKAALLYYGVELGTYQGIDSMGKINIGEFPLLLRKTFFQFMKIPLQNYYGMTSTPILRYSVLILGILCIGMIVIMLMANKRSVSIYFGIMGLCLIFPFAVNCIQIMCPHSTIYTLMIYAAVFIYLVPLILIQRILTVDLKSYSGILKNILESIRQWGGGIIFAIYILVILNYIWLSNGNYTAMYYMNRQTENFMTTMLTRVQSTTDFNTSLKWVFVGENFSDPNFKYSWSVYSPYLYGGNSTSLINAYSRNSFIRHFQGYSMPLADSETSACIEKFQFVKEMPCYPADGSIRVYKDFVIIKLEEV